MRVLRTKYLYETIHRLLSITIFQMSLNIVFISLNEYYLFDECKIS